MMRRSAIVALILAGLPAAAHAIDANQYWTVVIGLEGRAVQRWLGADQKYIFAPTPILNARPAGTPESFRSPRDGFGLSLYDNGRLRIGPVGTLRYPRKQADDPKLAGLGDVDWTVELGMFADYMWAPWLRTRAEVRQGVSGHHGLVADLIADAIAPVSRQLTLSAGPRITFATTAATSPYYSVNTVQSAASGLPIYDAKGGVRSVGAGAQARYLWTPQWGTHVFVEYERLTADSKNNPIVSLRGSPDQWTFGVGVTYAFNMKALW